MVWGKSSAHLSRVVEPLLTEWGRLLLAVGSVCKMAWGKLCAHPSRAVEPLLTGWGKLSALADVHQDDSPPLRKCCRAQRRLFCLTVLFAALTCNAATIEGKVVGVVDGDTITVLDSTNTQHKIRLSGIDAPEKSQPFGNRSKQSLSDLVFYKAVTVDTEKRDKYKRNVCKVLVDGVDANLEQVRRGMAWHYKAYEREQSAIDRKAYLMPRLKLRRLDGAYGVIPHPSRLGSSGITNREHQVTTELFIILLLVIAIILGYACYSDLRKDVQTMAIALSEQQRTNCLAQTHRLEELEAILRQVTFRMRDSNIMTHDERARDREERMHS